MADRKRSESGQIEEYPRLSDVLGFVNESTAPVGSPDVAEAFEVTTQTARNKLRGLEERGDVASKAVGRTRVYWPSSTIPQLQQVVRRHNARHESEWPTDADSLSGVLPKILSEARENESHAE